MYTEMKKKAWEVSDILKILSHEKRLWILCLLLDGEKNISQLQDTLEISQSLVSQFALKMRDQWILESRKEWKEVLYKIKDKKIQELIKTIKTIYC
jgi:DNA-binding transcriptional ArsR family regulator